MPQCFLEILPEFVITLVVGKPSLQFDLRKVRFPKLMLCQLVSLLPALSVRASPKTPRDRVMPSGPHHGVRSHTTAVLAIWAIRPGYWHAMTDKPAAAGGRAAGVCLEASGS